MTSLGDHKQLDDEIDTQSKDYRNYVVNQEARNLCDRRLEFPTQRAAWTTCDYR